MCAHFMLILKLLILTLIPLLDYIVYRRTIKESGAKLWQRGVFVVVAALSYLLGVSAFLMHEFVADNTTTVIHIVSWSLFVCIITIVPRLIYYASIPIKQRKIGAVLAVMSIVFFIWGATHGRTSYVINSVDIYSNKLPESFDGFEIVQISDIHVGTMIRPVVELRRLVNAINSLNADLVVVCGDLINITYTELDEDIMQVLGDIKAQYGVVSNIGNHDTGYYVSDTLMYPPAMNIKSLIERQHKMGWRVLDNQSEIMCRNGDSISISAVSFCPSLHKQRHDQDLKQPNLEQVYTDVDSSMYNITLSHLPQFWDDIVELGYGDLTLAGHVHSMQMKLTIGDLSISPARLLYKRWSGRYDNEGSTLYINDGIGYVGFPMRLGAYPEITLLRLKR